MHSRRNNAILNIRYDYAVETAYDFLIEQNIDSLPFDPFKICAINGWTIEKASVLSKDLGCTINKLLKDKLKSKDGAAIYCPTTHEYSIIYNDLINNKGRIRWTLTHEIGHIVLRHLNNSVTSLYRNSLTDDKYYCYEKEADCFAGVVLAPPIVLKKLHIDDNSSKIKKLCKLSNEASKSRLQYINQIYNFKYFEDYYPIIINNFYNFIYKKQCPNCNYGSISKNAIFCPICSDKLIWGDGTMKYRNNVKLDKNGKALICPRCENEDITEFDMYCKICGGYLYQECGGVTDYDINGQEYRVAEGCKVRLDSNARYCTQCGEKTTFYKYGYLDDWEKEKQEIEIEKQELETASSLDFFDNDPPF